MNSSATVNMVIGALIVSAVGFGLAAWHLDLHGKEYAPFLACATGAVGAISGLLANTGTHPKPDTTITTKTTDKVETSKVPDE